MLLWLCDIVHCPVLEASHVLQLIAMAAMLVKAHNTQAAAASLADAYWPKLQVEPAAQVLRFTWPGSPGGGLEVSCYEWRRSAWTFST